MLLFYLGMYIRLGIEYFILLVLYVLNDDCITNTIEYFKFLLN
jgi:hypothetical protein